MGRNTKKGLDYFPFDIDFFQDIRIRKLIKYQGGKSVTVYTLLLCFIYKSGYYMRWDDELPFIISEQSGFDEVYIQEVIKSCLSIGLFDKCLYDNERVLSSHGIQERYKKICALSRRSYAISEYNLSILPEKEVKEKPATIKKTKQVEVETVKYEPYTLLLAQEIDALKKDECWLDQLQVLHSMDIGTLKTCLDDFRVQCVADGKERHMSLQDAKQHFNSWLRIINNKKWKTDDKDRTNGRNQRRGNILSSDEKKTYGGSF